MKLYTLIITAVLALTTTHTTLASPNRKRIFKVYTRDEINHADEHNGHGHHGHHNLERMLNKKRKKRKPAPESMNFMSMPAIANTVINAKSKKPKPGPDAMDSMSMHAIANIGINAKTKKPKAAPGKGIPPVMSPVEMAEYAVLSSTTVAPITAENTSADTTDVVDTATAVSPTLAPAMMAAVTNPTKTNVTIPDMASSETTIASSSPSPAPMRTINTVFRTPDPTISTSVGNTSPSPTFGATPNGGGGISITISPTLVEQIPATSSSPNLFTPATATDGTVVTPTTSGTSTSEDEETYPPTYSPVASSSSSVDRGPTSSVAGINARKNDVSGAMALRTTIWASLAVTGVVVLVSIC